MLLLVNQMNAKQVKIALGLDGKTF